ncbi:MAG: bifunctional oligoribonuclease/PAP phosphatase NrnA [Bacilli bacterium]
MKLFEKKLLKKTKHSNNIFIMGHKSLDLDALGAAAGISVIAKKYNKDNVKIIINDQEHESAVKLALEYLKDKITVTNSKNITNINQNDLLIIIDVNKKYLLQDETLLNKFKNIILIDHHTIGKGSIKNDNSYINTTYSSTCEMVTEIILDKKIKIPSQIATVLLSGIVLDTNSYAINTTEQTFFYSAYLTSLKADTRKVQTLLKQDFEDYKERQKLILNVQFIDKKTAISVGSNTKFYRREYLAKAADTLLLFKGIETSYVIGRLNNEEIGISARSLTDGKVNKVLSNLNGGGSPREAAAVVQETSLEKVQQLLIKHIK